MHAAVNSGVMYALTVMKFGVSSWHLLAVMFSRSLCTVLPSDIFVYFIRVL